MKANIFTMRVEETVPCYQKLVNCGIWKHLTDVMTPQQALELLQNVASDPEEVNKRISHVKENGLQSYTTACGWLGYTDDYMSSKIKVLSNHPPP